MFLSIEHQAAGVLEGNQKRIFKKIFHPKLYFQLNFSQVLLKYLKQSMLYKRRSFVAIVRASTLYTVYTLCTVNKLLKDAYRILSAPIGLLHTILFYYTVYGCMDAMYARLFGSLFINCVRTIFTPLPSAIQSTQCIKRIIWK